MQVQVYCCREYRVERSYPAIRFVTMAPRSLELPITVRPSVIIVMSIRTVPIP